MDSRPGNWVDLKALKQSLSLEAILGRYGVELRRVGRTLRGRCPLPTHDPHKIAQSFMVNTVKNVWACHSGSCQAGRNGKVGGNALDFVMLMENCSIAEAGRRLQEWGGKYPIVENRSASQETSIDSQQERNSPLHFELRGIDYAHPYLMDRGIKAETAAEFGIGYYGEPGIMKGRVVIPIHNQTGELVAYAGRAIDGAEPKYRFPRGFLKSQELFNLHRIIPTGAREVILVEGYFDCVNVHQAGITNVAALMGSTLSKPQLALLKRHFERVILMLDGDKPGRDASVKIAEQLRPHLAVGIAEVPDGKQPDQLSHEELNALIATSRTRPSLVGNSPKQPQPAGVADTDRRVQSVR
jgi:DNA primase